MNDVEIRIATDDDLELLMAWRSNELVYKYFAAQKKPLTWQEHINFWRLRKNRQDWIIYYLGRKVGSVNATFLDTDCPEIGILIGELTLWGSGVGGKAVSLVLEWLKENNYKMAQAIIMPENTASRRLFEKLCFSESNEGSARKKAIAEAGIEILLYTKELK